MSVFKDKDGNLVEFVVDADVCAFCNKQSAVMFAHHHGYRGGIEVERERILHLVYSLEPKLLTEGATARDIDAFTYAVWQFRHQLAEAIKGENK